MDGYGGDYKCNFTNMKWLLGSDEQIELLFLQGIQLKGTTRGENVEDFHYKVINSPTLALY